MVRLMPRVSYPIKRSRLVSLAQFGLRCKIANARFMAQRNGRSEAEAEAEVLNYYTVKRDPKEKDHGAESN